MTLYDMPCEILYSILGGTGSTGLFWTLLIFLHHSMWHAIWISVLYFRWHRKHRAFLNFADFFASLSLTCHINICTLFLVAQEAQSSVWNHMLFISTGTESTGVILRWCTFNFSQHRKHRPRHFWLLVRGVFVVLSRAESTTQVGHLSTFIWNLSLV